jgi:hypothetical protein
VSAAVWPLVKNDILKADRTQEEGHLIFRRIVTAMHYEHLVAWMVGPGAVLARTTALDGFSASIAGHFTSRLKRRRTKHYQRFDEPAPVTEVSVNLKLDVQRVGLNLCKNGLRPASGRFETKEHGAIGDLRPVESPFDCSPCIQIGETAQAQ